MSSGLLGTQAQCARQPLGVPEVGRVPGARLDPRLWPLPLSPGPEARLLPAEKAAQRQGSQPVCVAQRSAAIDDT